MQYGMKLATAGVLAALAVAVNAEPVKLPNGNVIEWTGPEEARVIPPVEGDDWMQLLVAGDGITIGRDSDWQNIGGMDRLALYGRENRIYAAETHLEGGLLIAGDAQWMGSPNTLMHRMATLALCELDGDATRLSLMSGMMVVDAVEWNTDSELELRGYSSSIVGGTSGSGATLAAKTFSLADSAEGSPVLKVRLAGNSTLVLGEKAFSQYADQGADGVKRLKSLITDAAIQGQADRATLVTTSATIYGLADGVTIEVGTTGTLPERESASDTSPRVVIGSQGRWILSLSQGEASTVMLAAAESETTKVEALAGAELYLKGWDGRDLTSIQLDSSWQGKQLFIANSLFLGDAVVDGSGTLTITHRAWSELSGLTAREVLGEAEGVFLQGGEGVVTDIGRQYLASVMQGVSSVQNEHVAARSIDETVFLAGASGLLSAADRSHRRLHFGLLEHDPEMVTAGDDTYWWAQAYCGHGSMDKLRSGSDWGYKEDFYGGTLGADWRFASKWIATAAFSGATSDIDTTGTLRGSDAESASLTMAAAGASLTYLANDRHRLHAAVTYSQTQGEAKKISTGYRMKTEPDFRMLSADLGWSAHYAVTDNLQVKPSVSVGMDTGRMRKGDITLTTQDGTNSAVGFVQTTGNRRMWHVKGRLETSGKFSVWRYNVEPGFNAGVTLYAGDTDWRVASRLAEGTAVSTEKFHAVGHWNLSGGLNLRISDVGREPIMAGGIFGFGAKDTGKSRAYAWSLDLSAAAETGPYGTEAATFGVRYRELF